METTTLFFVHLNIFSFIHYLFIPYKTKDQGEITFHAEVIQCLFESKYKRINFLPTQLRWVYSFKESFMNRKKWNLHKRT